MCPPVGECAHLGVDTARLLDWLASLDRWARVAWAVCS